MFIRFLTNFEGLEEKCIFQRRVKLDKRDAIVYYGLVAADRQEYCFTKVFCFVSFYKVFLSFNNFFPDPQKKSWG